MTVVQTAVVFGRVETIPLDKVGAGFTSSLLQHQRQYSAYIVLPAIRSFSQCHVNTTDGSTIGIVLSVPWIDKMAAVQAESKL